MNFKAQKINKRKPKLPPKPKFAYEKPSLLTPQKIKWIFLTIAILVTIPFTFKAFAKIIKFTGEEIIGKTIIKTIGSKLPSDKDGYTNFLALGVGGAQHIAGSLTDTILIASVNQKTDDIIMISLPRDMYVKHELTGGVKINTVYQTLKYKYDEETAFQSMSEIAESITGLKIHYYAKIDFTGLENIVDALGGIDINIDKTIYDPYYPGPNYSYQTFSIGKGPQHLDGATALKYARSRHTTSDFDRSNRQQQIIFALKEKALSLHMLTDKSQMEALLKAIQDNFYTNMSLREMISMGEIALDLDKSKINNLVLHDDPNTPGGFLYAPARTEEGQAYVLLPNTGNYDQIHTFVQLHKDFPDVMLASPAFDTVNATNSPYLASAAKQSLKRFGFRVINTTDSTTKDLQESILEHPLDTDTNFIQALNQVIPAESVDLSLPSLSDFQLEMATDLPRSSINLILGEDFIELYNELEKTQTSLPTISHQDTSNNTESTLSEENAHASSSFNSNQDSTATENNTTNYDPININNEASAPNFHPLSN